MDKSVETTSKSNSSHCILNLQKHDVGTRSLLVQPGFDFLGFVFYRPLDYDPFAELFEFL